MLLRWFRDSIPIDRPDITIEHERLRSREKCLRYLQEGLSSQIGLHVCVRSEPFFLLIIKALHGQDDRGIFSQFKKAGGVLVCDYFNQYGCEYGGGCLLVQAFTLGRSTPST